MALSLGRLCKASLMFLKALLIWVSDFVMEILQMAVAILNWHLALLGSCSRTFSH